MPSYRCTLPLPLLADEPGASSSPVSYHWSPSSDPALFPGRQAGVFAGEQQVGVFGIVHPEVGTWAWAGH